MKLRGLLIATMVLAALSGTLYWSNHRKPAESATKISTDTTPKILSLQQADISRIDIKKKDTPELELVKADGSWKITKPQALGADQDAVSRMLSTLSSLDADRVIEEKSTDLTPFGLKDPSLTVEVSTADDKAHRLLVGDDTPSGNASYAMLAGDARVFTLASYQKSNIDRGENDLRDKRLLTADFDKASQIELITPKEDVVFGRNKNQWQMVKPRPLRADNYQVEELIRTLREAKMDLAGAGADEKKDAAAFSSGKAVASAKVTGISGTQVLQLRKNKEDYYAKSSEVAGVYRVASGTGKGLDKKLEDFLNKKLFDFGYADPDRIEIHDGAKAYFLTRSGTDWWGPDGEKLDLDSADALLEKIRDLSARKFPETGFGKPVVELTVVSNDKKSAEKVLISKTGERYFAKRENEPELYEIATTSISDLQKAAAALKPAAPPTSEKKK